MHRASPHPHDTTALLIILAAVFLVFGQCIGADLVWDDKNLIVNNPWLSHSETFFQTWTQDFWSLTNGGGESGMYRPIVIDAYWLEYKLWGTDARGYHTVNLILHAINAGLIFILARRFALPTRASFFGALCFAIHPVQVETAASVASHTDILATLGTLSACVLWTRSSRRGWVCLPIFFALCSKESAVVAPLLLLVLDRYLGRPLLRKEQLWLVLAWFPWFLLRMNAVGSPIASVTSSWEGGSRILTYLGRILIPIPQGPITEISPPSFEWAFASMLLLIFAGLYFLSKSSKNRFLFFGLWILIALAPVSEIFPFGARFSDLLLYLPMCGFALGVAEAIAALEVHVIRKQAKKLLFGGFALLLCTWAIISVRWSEVWMDDVRLWTHGVLHAPQNVTAHLNLGNAYRAIGKKQEGFTQLMHALDWVDPEKDTGSASRVHYNLGNSLREQGMFSAAESHYRTTITLTNGGFLPARYNLIVTQAAMGRPDLGLIESTKLIHQVPQLPNPWHLHGIMLAQLKRYDDAVEAFDRAISIDPAHPDSAQYRQQAAQLAESSPPQKQPLKSSP